METVKITLSASQDTLVSLSNPNDNSRTQYLLLAGSSKELTLFDDEIVNIGKTIISLVNPV